VTSSAEQKLSLRALIALVVGSMVGSGIFAIPSSFGRATGGLGALIAWVIAGVGMLKLAFVFQTLARRREQKVPIFTRVELLLFGVIAAAATAGLYGLASGAISV
jgi:arginine:ornithine antiporter/lysine permease